MLISCKECNLMISDKASFCPHCGYPIKPDKIPKKSTKRRRLPNGFGQISKIKNKKLRKPYRAMVTVGKTDKGRPICKPLKPNAYFETYNDAYVALLNYNKSPYDLDKQITINELFEEWFEKRSFSANYARNIKSRWKHCESLYNISIRDIRPQHIKVILDNQKIPPVIRTKIKIILNQVFDYAIEYELTDKNYARNIKISNLIKKEDLEVKDKHITYTDEEVKKIKGAARNKIVAAMIYVQCYSGWRPQELCLLKVKDVDIKNWFFKGGMKTEAGKNREVPIHRKIRGIVEHNYKRAIEYNCEYLFFQEHIYKSGPREYTYQHFHNEYTNLLNELKFERKHKPHDGRKHFITLAKKYNLNEYAIKYIVGHAISDMTEGVYTERSKEWLADEMAKIEKEL